MSDLLNYVAFLCMIVVGPVPDCNPETEATEEPGTNATNKVAIFRTQCYPVFEVLPGYITSCLFVLLMSSFASGFVQGQDNEYPVWVEFAGYHKNGSILTTVSWVLLIFAKLSNKSQSGISLA